MDTFQVGEIAITCNLVTWPEFNGCDVEIIGPLETGECWLDRAHTQYGSMTGYRVLFCVAGLTGRIQPHKLRKKRPPSKREEVGDWDLCPWQPAQVTVSGNG